MNIIFFLHTKAVELSYIFLNGIDNSTIMLIHVELNAIILITVFPNMR